MSDTYDDLDDDSDVGNNDAAEISEPDALVYGSVDEFVRENLSVKYRRVMGPSNRAPRRWSAEWWKSAEVGSRLEALWRSWERLRLDGATGSSTWWRDHLVHHMPILMSPDGPFADSEDQNKPDEPLPYRAPPAGLFPDVRK